MLCCRVSEWLFRPFSVRLAMAFLMGLASVALAQTWSPSLPAAGMFLVAHAGMPDARFARSVVLLVSYGPEGALGLVVNRPTDVRLASAFPEVKTLRDSEDLLWSGGPVQPHRASMLISSDRAPTPSIKVLPSLHFSTRIQDLESLGPLNDGVRFRAYAGYAGWAPSQLDAELARGDWILRTASVEQIFAEEGTDHLWDRLMEPPGRWVMRSKQHDSGQFL